MPKTKIDRMTKREREIRAIISAGLKRQDMSMRDLADKLCMTPPTLYRRYRNPFLFTVRELLSIGDYLELTNEDRLHIIEKL